MTIKILNLYAGIGGNRKLWDGDIEVTAVEIDPKIAEIYKDFFPNDKVIVGDAHEYLLKHFKEFDFIWSSPPCPTHSRFNHLNEIQNKEIKYPEMSLYQEIILLTKWFKGKWVVENVISYYDPLIKPQERDSHYYWSNFILSNSNKINRRIRGKHTNLVTRSKLLGFNLSKYNLNNKFKTKIINNCVEPEAGLQIFKMAFKEKQKILMIK